VAQGKVKKVTVVLSNQTLKI